MSWKATTRAFEAARRRQEREARARELEARRQFRIRERQFRENLRRAERESREQAKQQGLEQARLEVQSFEREIDLLTSFHRTLNEPIDWLDLASTLIPPPPQRVPYRELTVSQTLAIAPAAGDTSAGELIRQAKEQDDRDFAQEAKAYAQEEMEWSRMKDLALAVLSKSPESYLKAIEVIAPFADMSDLGTSTRFMAHSASFVECVITVHGEDVIPDEMKTLTTSGKVSIRPMPRARFHELYQDHVCSALLRVSREVFSLLPVESLLVTALAEVASEGEGAQSPVLSVFVRRPDLHKLDFARLDPSDAIESLVHRGDFKAGRKAGAFQTIVPLTAADFVGEGQPAYEAAIAEFQRCRTDVQSELERLVFDEVED